MSVQLENSHMQESWEQSTSVASAHHVQHEGRWVVAVQGQGQHQVTSLDKPHFFIAQVTTVAVVFRRGRSPARCVGRYSSAPPPSRLTCSYIQTSGLTPASTVASGSTRSLTWRNTRSYTQVGPRTQHSSLVHKLLFFTNFYSGIVSLTCISMNHAWNKTAICGYFIYIFIHFDWLNKFCATYSFVNFRDNGRVSSGTVERPRLI